VAVTAWCALVNVLDVCGVAGNRIAMMTRIGRRTGRNKERHHDSHSLGLSLRAVCDCGHSSDRRTHSQDQFDCLGAGGLCPGATLADHRIQMIKHKTVAPTLTAADIQRFWDYVDKSGGCWLWLGAKGKGYDTYGRFNVRGRVLRSSRLAYFITTGDWTHLEIRHLCDTPQCVNPAHLVPSTHAENMADMKIKHRGAGRLTGLTRCQKAGHPLEGENLLIKSGKRLCRLCRRETERRLNADIGRKRALRPRFIMRACRQCRKSFDQDMSVGRPAIYCSTRCKNKFHNSTRSASL